LDKGRENNILQCIWWAWKTTRGCGKTALVESSNKPHERNITLNHFKVGFLQCVALFVCNHCVLEIGYCFVWRWDIYQLKSILRWFFLDYLLCGLNGKHLKRKMLLDEAEFRKPNTNQRKYSE